MRKPWYERLSMLDCSFLVFEGPQTYMHIAATTIFEAGGLATPDGGVDIGRIRSYIGSRVPAIPRYRQRLAYTPIDGHPVWVDDDCFELSYHVRHTSLPRPGTEAQLREFCARLLERPLNRSKPLWEAWVIEGLSGGGFALLLKVHHCMVDGLAGAELLAALLSPVPETEWDDPPEWNPRPAPSGFELLRDEVTRRAKLPFDLLQEVRNAVQEPREVQAQLTRRLAAAWKLVRDGVRQSGATPFNRPIGAHRRFHWAALDLGEVKAVKNRLGGTVNDVVLATVSGAVRRFLLQRQVSLFGLDFRVGVPVSVRSEEERGTAGNRVSIWIMPLCVQERYPARRLNAVRAASARFKETDQAGGGDVLAQAAEWTGANVLSMGLAVANRNPPFNLIVTNVPGPQVPLYLAGARMLAAYPLVPLFSNQGLGIALFSYDGKLFWGLNADWDTLPDVDRFAAAIEESFAELRTAAQQRIIVPPARRRPVRRAQPPRVRTGRRAAVHVATQP
jgi:diacylglycerol O-acyltransferase / wax synthase